MALLDGDDGRKSTIVFIGDIADAAAGDNLSSAVSHVWYVSGGRVCRERLVANPIPSKDETGEAMRSRGSWEGSTSNVRRC